MKKQEPTTGASPKGDDPIPGGSLDENRIADTDATNSAGPDSLMDQLGLTHPTDMLDQSPVDTPP